MIYIIGSLRNPEIPNIANQLRCAGHEVFDDWFAAGPTADDNWRDYEKQRGRTFVEGLQGLAARNVYAFDRRNLERADVVVLVAPAGKSGHLELGWALGQGKRGYYLLDNPDRWDVMLQFCTGVCTSVENLLHTIARDQMRQETTNAGPSRVFEVVHVCGSCSNNHASDADHRSVLAAMEEEEG